MSTETGIQWTDHTFNPWWGCLRVSPGCEHCYAETLAKRFGFDVWGPAKTTERRLFGEQHWREPLAWNAAAEREGRRHRVFCASMADVFEDHPRLIAEREKLWALIRATPWLDWQLLTKRPENIARMLPPDWGDGYRNVWLGTSVESEAYTDRVLHLLCVRAHVRFLSCEPLLGDISNRLGIALCIRTNERNEAAPEGDVRGYDRPGIHWIIIGGESGAGARPFNLEWARAVIAAARTAGAAPFVKQLGAVPMEVEEDWRGRAVTRLLNAHNRDRVPPGFVPLKQLYDSHGGDMAEWPEDLRVREFPESRA